MSTLDANGRAQAEQALVELDAAHRSAIKELIFGFAPTLMGLIAFLALRKQRRQLRALLNTPEVLEVFHPDPEDQMSYEHSLERILSLLPVLSGVSLDVDERGNARIVDYHGHTILSAANVHHLAVYNDDYIRESISEYLRQQD